MTSNSHGFWSGGAGAHYDGLKQQHETALAALREKLAACESDAQRAEIQGQIKAAKSEFKGNLRGAGRLLF